MMIAFQCTIKSTVTIFTVSMKMYCLILSCFGAGAHDPCMSYTHQLSLEVIQRFVFCALMLLAHS